MSITDFSPADMTELPAVVQRKILRLAAAGAGMRGIVVVANTTATIPPGNATAFCKIKAVTATVLSAVSGQGITGSLAGVTIAAGNSIEGYFTSVTLTSGTAVLYVL